MAINPYKSWVDYQGMEVRPGTVDLGALLYAPLEQNLRLDVLQDPGFDIEPYTQGITFPQAGPFGYYQFGHDPTGGQQMAGINEVMKRLYAAQPEAFKSSFNPYASFSDWNARQESRPGFSGSWTDMFKAPFEAGKDLLAEPGFVQLLATAAGGQMLGGPAGGSAAAGGTAAGGGGTLMPAAIPPVDPTFGGMLAQTGPGSWAQPAWTGGAFGAGTGALAASTPSVASPAAAPASSSFAGTAPGVAGGTAAGGAAASSGIANLLSSPMALGMGAGALLGGLGGSEQAGTVTVEEGLPDWLQGYAKPALDRYTSELQNFNVDPYGVLPSAMKEFQNTIGGMYLDPSTNKYLEDYFKAGAERIKGALSPSFGHMQAFGAHSGYNEALSRGLGDFSTGLYGGVYEKERDRMSNLTAAAPSFIGQTSTAQFAPYQQYLGTLGSLGRKKDEPYFENPFGNILGGAMLGGSLGRIWG